MQRKRLLGLGVLLVAAAVIFQLSGCSIIGFGIGALSDASKPNQVTIPGWQVETIKSGTRIDIILNDGTRLSGKYAGLNRPPPEEYAGSYAKSQEQIPEGVVLPTLGDSVTVILKSGKQYKCQFLGFDYQCIKVRVAGRTGTEIGTVHTNNLSKVEDKHGNILELETVRRLMSEGKIPLLSAIAFQSDVGRTMVAMDKVYQIQVPVKKHSALTGLLVGAAVDVIVLAVILTSKPEPQGEGSCPFVYSFDDKSYVLDSETFGGAIFKAAQRTDWDNLNHLSEVQGSYRLKITDELQETQYIDQVKLLVVDHPKGTNVVPSFSGELHVLSKPRLPMKVVDLSGNEVPELVKAKDERFWVSNPFGRNPEIKAQVRDGLVLDFPRPNDAGFVKLSFNVQNTLWATYVEGQLLKLYGSELENWYALMNRSTEAREGFRKAVTREGMLLIKLWNGESWQDSGIIWFIGPHVPKDQAVWLDISHIPGELLHVRLESTAGLWMINSVQADYTPDLPLHITELSPRWARDYEERDLRQVLNDIDDQYYVLSITQDRAELVFTASSRRDGYDRSFILKNTGYYKIK